MFDKPTGRIPREDGAAAVTQIVTLTRDFAQNASTIGRGNQARRGRSSDCERCPTWLRIDDAMLVRHVVTRRRVHTMPPGEGHE